MGVGSRSSAGIDVMGAMVVVGVMGVVSVALPGFAGAGSVVRVGWEAAWTSSMWWMLWMLWRSRQK